ncbi:DNA adenine methylase [candidate division TA06 bacterium]|uniref:site-specific DNA-methyltransferase (adenine-specific) n=1 Tax=candidate division TA06 bacterium TaxID=2250710 RepID=A0A933ICB0_UNCT6|nr:DNA adenine methylase [candidate division TA06 bacterium]
MPSNTVVESPQYLEEQIITYIGNKRSLLTLIDKAVNIVKGKLGCNKISALDLFSGSGIVARNLKKHTHTLYVNDIEYYSQILNKCYLTNKSFVNIKEIEEKLLYITDKIRKVWEPGFITDLYAPKDETIISNEDRVFYTKRNAIYIDTARQLIAELPEKEQHFFLAPLLVEASIHANTSGVFKGFYKNANGIGQYGGHKKDALKRILNDININTPIFSFNENKYYIYRSDANDLVRKIPHVDLAYFDPPYNQHPYGSNYFMLNLIARYEKPDNISKVSGIPTDWNRSKYNAKKVACATLFDALENCNAKYILLSYNSEGFVPHCDLLKEIKKIGNVEVLETPYNTYRGSRNLWRRPIHVTEYLYLLEKNNV